MNFSKILLIFRSTIETKISIVGVGICGLVAIHLILLINTRFTLWPEMVVYPYLLNNGFVLYKDIINPYMPAFTYALSIFARFFGYEPVPYQILTWLAVVIIDLLIFLTARSVTGKISKALIATAFFIILSIPFSVNGLWFDLVQTPLILLSVYYFWRFSKDKRLVNLLFLSAIFITFAFFIKQQVAWLIIWFLIVSFLNFRRKALTIISKNLKIIFPALVIFLLHILFFMINNLLSDFLYWTIYFPYVLSSSLPGYLLLPSFRQILTILVLFFLFTPLIFTKKQGQKFFVLTAAVLLLFAYPRFDYFHLIPALAVLSLALPKNVELIKTSNQKLVIFAVSFMLLLAFTARYFQRNWTGEIRFFEKEIFESAQIIQKINPGPDPIYVQNGPDQILPFAKKLPPKPWVDEFPWYLESSSQQQKIVEGLRRQNPEFVVFKPYLEEGMYELGTYKPELIASYIEDNYKDFVQISDSLWLKKRN
ncbi:hypothetical protein A3D81_01330 [Candidatus Curtissbacteria bacterium RIFCSPHIGHO2_02_FULL_40_17]|uniref:Uncharacterized protein n=2 Tax=Candidatus Curtissiibacteriota TaxID=1752717 RepID=A0A1F5GHS0_9BACT|nr:MAG: hypothetical protein A3D81_01330 [Candidatus Curtissbacteria bacterium RIFCSPHIGHO2_02_FULL_40_17]OGE08632.1 MAG: hypothetical protein A3I53_02585 [Candidatus Curtissbacteria bacterium RIFCSPLOWO2_02_FULL_40_13b]